MTSTAGARSGLHRAIVKSLDAFLSESLRRSSPSELARMRVLVGATCFLLVFDLSYVALVPLSPPVLAALGVAVGFVATLVAARWARSPTTPAAILCTNNALGFLAATFLSTKEDVSIHTGHMLVPALSVYLMGPRLAVVLTAFYALALGVIHPAYFEGIAAAAQLPLAPSYWPMHIASAVALMGAWALGALHSTARDEAQSTLERTLAELRDSRSKLSSVIESTDDPVISMDTQGRVLTANAAALRIYQQRFGRELQLGAPFIGPQDPQILAIWSARMAQVLQGQSLHFEQEQPVNGSRVVLDFRINPILGEGRQVTGMTLFARDITSRKAAEARLGELHRTLLDVSRQAGMSEIATGVLHNVGNTLNSVNTSTSVLRELLRKSRVSGVARAAQLLQEHAPELGTFLTSDPQGQKFPSYLMALAEHLAEEREAMNKELLALNDSVDHIKAIVNMQPWHSHTAGAIEEIQVPQLIDEALRLHAVSFERRGIHIEREYAEVPPIEVDRHKLLQILINLVLNAQQALEQSAREDKRLTLRVRLNAEGQRLCIDAADNGHGIAPEHLPRIFTQGFTTKKTGHGFGLHISSLAATEMKGRLTCASPGPGQGATFTLELPLVDEA